MAVQEQRVTNTLERYIAEVRSVWGDDKDPQLPFKVAALMQKLFASTSPDDPWMTELIREGKPSREFATVKALMYREPEVWRALMEKLADCFAGYVDRYRVPSNPPGR